MASVKVKETGVRAKETSKKADSVPNPDLSTVQQLIFSVGQLKFSLRALSSMHLHSALLAQKETETPTKFPPLQSNAVLENVINEVLSSKSDKTEETTETCKTNVDQNSISVEDLELVQRKLQEELENRQQAFLASMSNKMK